MRSYDKELIEKAIAYVRQDLGKAHRTALLSVMVYMGETKFKSLFKQYTNQSFHEWLVEERMQYAVILLKDSNITLKQTAKKCGYRHQRNFGKSFKKRWGVSPGNWKKIYA